MYYEPDHLILGGTPADKRTIQWTSDSIGANVDDINPDNLTIDWTVRPEDGEWLLRKGDENGTKLFRVSESLSRINTNFEIGGTLTSVDIGDSSIRLSKFDENGEITFRHSSSDSDQIVAVDRHGSNDYDLHIRQDTDWETVLTTADDGTLDAATFDGQGPSAYGELDANETVTGQWAFDEPINGTAEHAFDADDAEHAANSDLLEGEPRSTFLESHPTVENDGTEVSTDATVFNFGEDIGATSTSDGVLVEYVGASIPSVVYDNGNEILSNANGVDFLDDLDVTVGDNDIAEVAVNHDEMLLADAQETVTATWTFAETIDGTADHALTADNATNADHATTATDADHAAEADLATEAESLGGSALSEIGQLDLDETVTGEWTHEDNLVISGSNELRFDDGTLRARYSSVSNHLIFEDYSDGSSTSVMQVSATGTEFPQGITTGGNIVATEMWVENTAVANHAESADEAGHASTADHALTADDADNADHATNADNADHATEADHATTADSATDADHATSADSAGHADTAGHATTAGDAETWGGYEVVIDNETPSTDQYIRMETE